MKAAFDFDNTLYNLQTPLDVCVDELIEEPIDKDQFYLLTRKYNEELFPLQQAGKITYDEIMRRRLRLAMEDLHVDVSRIDLDQFIRRYKEAQDHIQISDLYRTYFMTTTDEIAILTNGDNTRQREKLAAAGLTELIPADHIFTSTQLGYAKPDPRVFLKMLELLGDKAENWYYIGDNYDIDMVGAKSAGLHTIHLNRHRQNEGPCSDHTVYTEAECIDLLKKLA
ncbi:HAD family hydrolase [Catenisphaera adipataccumulans]|jgi:putative hydrolase of the HAD superfamily|uniref:Putative hydrolase of the HAD superfamily n=1 Tax=Catenisphaera adipataccumulans TaxID=700500 RepID=A0A7W8FY56_9FIRM|nr:HAD family hydrolase [Catenisphaera adipataccumulans]MBB5183667.1 putative hydrolase of the HAD superfamily [Catenisphaera adipataccumulans]